jgi:ABC-type antimicrobial peptide transport system permease subunit
MIECGALGAMGAMLGVVLGLVLGAQIVLIGLRLVTGWSMGIEIPWTELAAGIVTATLVSAFAGYVPARAAVQIDAPRGAAD